jgi:serine/threonine protein kinase
VQDLFDYIHRRHGMSEGDMFVLVWQIMAGILHCHSKGTQW